MASYNFLHHICRIRVLHPAVEDLPPAHGSRFSCILLVSQLCKIPRNNERENMVPELATLMMDPGV